MCVLLLAVAWPFDRVRKLCTPRHARDERDGRLRWLDRVRVVGGMVVVAALTVPYVGVGDWLAALATQVLVIAPLATAFAVLPAVLVGWLVLVCVNRPHDWLPAAWAMRRPILTMLGAASGWLVPLGILAAMALLARAPDDGSASTAIRMLALFPLFFLLLVAVLAVLWMMFLCGRYWYRAVDGHPLLPAVSSLVFALGLILVRLEEFRRFPVVTRLPVVVDGLLTFGGPLVLCAFAVAEVVLLRRTGVTFRQRVDPESGCRP